MIASLIMWYSAVVLPFLVYAVAVLVFLGGFQ